MAIFLKHSIHQIHEQTKMKESNLEVEVSRMPPLDPTVYYRRLTSLGLKTALVHMLSVYLLGGTRDKK